MRIVKRTLYKEILMLPEAERTVEKIQNGNMQQKTELHKFYDS